MDKYEAISFIHQMLDDGYVDGVSITYGSAPRKHIWTYANGNYLGNGSNNCPCNNGSNATPPSMLAVTTTV